MFENVVYISQLRPDFDVIDLENELQLDANLNEVILDYAIHNNNAVFLAFDDSRFVEKVIVSRENVSSIGGLSFKTLNCIDEGTEPFETCSFCSNPRY